MIKLVSIEKSYSKNKIFENFNMEIKKGEFVAIYGASGCGKSTLFNCVGLLDQLDKGDILIDGLKIKNINSKEAMLLRRNTIGYMFQTYALIDEYSVYDNLKLSLEYEDSTKLEKSEKIDLVLEKLGLLNKKESYVYELSGGQQQRVSFARVLLQDPEIILADEPTGSLDRENKLLIMNFLKEENEKGKTILIVSHDDEIRNYASRVLEL